MLRGLVSENAVLSEADESRIDELQAQIDEIWSRRGDYRIDDEAWKEMPLFMEHISDEDVEKNSACAALSSIVYDEVPPEEIAANRKEQGNKAIAMAQNPDQVNKENLARAACHCYTEGIQAKGSDRLLNAQLYANRSLAHFLLSNFGHGLQDAQKAILLDPEYGKAYYRGAKCAERTRKYDLALDLLSKAKLVKEAPKGKQLEEIEALERQCQSGLAGLLQQEKKSSQRSRAAAAGSHNIMRLITSHGIAISPKPEVTSEQMQQYGRHLPYFDVEGVLHVPVLLMYDEYSQTDYMHDVATDALVAEMVEVLMPFPWDDRGRYRNLEDLVLVYKIDDGVKMPTYFEADMSWPLLEVMRSATYEMPMLQPVFHLVPSSSELLRRWGLRG